MEKKFEDKIAKICEGIDKTSFVLTGSISSDIDIIDGLMVARYKTIPYKEATDARDKFKDSKVTMAEIQMELLLRTLVCVFIEGDLHEFPENLDEKKDKIESMESNIVLSLIENMELFNAAVKMIINGTAPFKAVEAVKK